MSGTQSEQTKAVEQVFQELQEAFKEVAWKLWDERLSSKRAASCASRKASSSRAAQKDEKMKEQARAAAFILDLFLTHLRFMEELQDSSH